MWLYFFSLFIFPICLSLKVLSNLGLFFVFSLHLIEQINFADDWIRTADLVYRKQLLYHLRHNHCPSKKIGYSMIKLTPDTHSLSHFGLLQYCSCSSNGSTEFVWLHQAFNSSQPSRIQSSFILTLLGWTFYYNFLRPIQLRCSLFCLSEMSIRNLCRNSKIAP